MLVSVISSPNANHFPFFFVFLYINANRIMMNYTLSESRKDYQIPALRIIETNLENVICDSTIPGGNEDIGYEDWD